MFARYPSGGSMMQGSHNTPAVVGCANVSAPVGESISTMRVSRRPPGEPAGPDDHARPASAPPKPRLFLLVGLIWEKVAHDHLANAAPRWKRPNHKSPPPDRQRFECPVLSSAIGDDPVEPPPAFHANHRGLSPWPAASVCEGPQCCCPARSPDP